MRRSLVAMGVLAAFAFTGPSVSTADVLSARYGGYEDSCSYGPGGGSSNIAAGDVFEAVAIAQKPVAPRGGPLVSIRTRNDYDAGTDTMKEPGTPNGRGDVEIRNSRGDVETRNSRGDVEYHVDETRSTGGVWRVERIEQHIDCHAPGISPFAPSPQSETSNGVSEPLASPAAAPQQPVQQQPAPQQPANVNCLQYCYANTPNNPALYLPCANHIQSSMMGTTAQCQAAFHTATVLHQNVSP